MCRLMQKDSPICFSQMLESDVESDVDVDGNYNDVVLMNIDVDLYFAF